MLFTQQVLEGIAAGEIDLAFRRWQQPRVRIGTELRTAVGLVAIDAVDVVDPSGLDERAARRAGFPSLAALLDELDRTPDRGGGG